MSIWPNTHVVKGTPREQSRHTFAPALRTPVAWAAFALTLVAVCLGFALATPRAIERGAGAADARRFFYGLGPLEENESSGFRWSGRDWGVALFGLPLDRPALVTLHASATRPEDEAAALLRLVGTSASAAFPIERAPRVYHLLAHPTDDAHGRQRITFTGSTFTPAGGDGRQLGIAVAKLRVEQPGGAPLLPLAARAVFLAGIATALAMALRQCGAPFVLALCAGGVLGLGLGMFQLSAASFLGYLLPNSWPLLGSVALALLVFPARRWLASGTFMPRPWLAACSFALTIGATVLLWLRAVPVEIGVVLVLGGAVATAIALPHVRFTSATERHPLTAFHPALFLVLTMAIALGLRLFRLNDQPIALWRDEVYHAELAQRIWADPSFRPIYVPEVDLPALLFYLIAPPIGMFGADLWTLRLVPALAGALTPLALWFALRPIFGQRVAMIAAWCMAVATWCLYMSRWTFPVIFDPLLTLTAIGCVWRGLGFTAKNERLPSLLWSAAGGVSAGLVMYTYHTGRIEPLVIGMFALLRILPPKRTSTAEWMQASMRAFAQIRLPLLVMLLAFGCTVAPLAHYALTNPQAFSKRFERVSIFNGPDAAPTSPLAVLEDQLGRHALMWHVRGDQNARHYAPFRPMLDPFGGALLLVGLGACLLRQRGAATAVLLLWLGVGLAPGIFSDVAPHAMRTIGALAPACALIGIGLDALLMALRPRAGFAVAVAMLGGMALWNAGLYFGVTGNLHEYFYHFETQRSMLARAARTAVNSQEFADTQVYMWQAMREGKAGQATTLLLNDAPVGWFDGAALDSPAGSSALLLLPGDIDPALAQGAERALGPQARLLRSGPPIPYGNAPIYLIYGVGPNAQQLADSLPLP